MDRSVQLFCRRVSLAILGTLCSHVLFAVPATFAAPSVKPVATPNAKPVAAATAKPVAASTAKPVGSPVAKGAIMTLADPAYGQAPQAMEVVMSPLHLLTVPKAEQLIALARQRGEPESVIMLATCRLLAVKHDFKGALSAAQKANQLKPGDPLYIVVLGQAYSYLDRQDDAERCYKQALKSKNLSSAAAELCLISFLEYDNFDEAYEAGKKGLAYQPNNGALLYRCADIAKNMGLFGEAEAYLNQGFKQGSKGIEIWTLYGEVERGLKKWREVIKACDVVLASGEDPSRKKMIEAQTHKAEAYQKLGEYKTAIKEWSVIIKRLPFKSQYLSSRAECYGAIGDKQSQARDLAEIKRLEKSLDY